MVKTCRDCPPNSLRPIKSLGRCATHSRAEKLRRSHTAHESRVTGTYGLRPGEYLLLYEAQGGRCAICQRATGKSKRLAVDHSHTLSGRESVRGLLCSTCNKMLGHGRDDPEFFRRAVAYLNDPPAREVLNGG